MNIHTSTMGRPARTAVAVLAAATLGLTAAGTVTATPAGTVRAASPVPAGSSTLPAGAKPTSASPALMQRPIVINRNVTFSGGVPVGGRTSLTLNPDGTFHWSGHMHDSGGTSYGFSGVCVVRFSSGTAFLFETRGRTHGTFEAGSRDHDWDKSGYKPALPSAWRASSSYRWACTNKTTLNLDGTADSVMKAVGYAAQVIAIVA